MARYRATNGAWKLIASREVREGDARAKKKRSKLEKEETAVMSRTIIQRIAA